MGNGSFEDKFIAFIDVMGFKSMIEQAERGKGRSLVEIKEILRELARHKSKEFFEKHGPQICPCSPRVDNHLSFQITQVSDCAIISSEVSPAGVINLVNHCWGAAIMLLTKGVMVRGYITRGSVVHDDTTLLGSGYQNAYAQEAGVTAFKKEASEKGTPFVEIDRAVVEYIENQEDACVKEMFSRMVASDGEVITALYPFKRLGHSFAIGGLGVPPFNPEKEKRSNDIVRQNIRKLIEGVNQYVAIDNEAALGKTRHYVAALEEQLRACDQTDEMIDWLSSPISRKL
jgi:hypothetical protein